jgi:hypothetical protein
MAWRFDGLDIQTEVEEIGKGGRIGLAMLQRNPLHSHGNLEGSEE